MFLYYEISGYGDNYDTENQNGHEHVIARMNLMGLPISKSSYAKIETNRMNVKVSELMALADIFHCEVGDFFKDLIKLK